MPLTLTLGIDPGLSGGLACLKGLEASDLVSAIAMPVRQVGKAKRPDMREIRAWLNMVVRQYGIPSLTIIEKSQTMRNRVDKETGEETQSGGPVQAHTQGLNAGMLLGYIDVLDWAMEEPPPQSWKAHVLKGFGAKDKAAMIAVVRQRFPTFSLLRTPKCKKPHDGMADAIGMALYGQYRLGKMTT